MMKVEKYNKEKKPHKSKVYQYVHQYVPVIGNRNTNMCTFVAKEISFYKSHFWSLALIGILGVKFYQITEGIFTIFHLKPGS